MIGAPTLVLVFQLFGEVLARMLALPIPGPVIGMTPRVGEIWVYLATPQLLGLTMTLLPDQGAC